MRFEIVGRGLDELSVALDAFSFNGGFATIYCLERLQNAKLERLTD
jgi:hypothetical protein